MHYRIWFQVLRATGTYETLNTILDDIISCNFYFLIINIWRLGIINFFANHFSFFLYKTINFPQLKIFSNPFLDPHFLYNYIEETKHIQEHVKASWAQQISEARTFSLNIISERMSYNRCIIPDYASSLW